MLLFFLCVVVWFFSKVTEIEASGDICTAHGLWKHSPVRAHTIARPIADVGLQNKAPEWSAANPGVPLAELHENFYLNIYRTPGARLEEQYWGDGTRVNLNPSWYTDHGVPPPSAAVASSNLIFLFVGHFCWCSFRLLKWRLEYTALKGTFSPVATAGFWWDKPPQTKLQAPPQLEIWSTTYQWHFMKF